jgi:hypothetical protein
MKKIFTVTVFILMYSTTYASFFLNRYICHDEIYTISTSFNHEISQTDSLISIDKKNVIEQTAKEVFNNYLDSIQSFRKYYGSLSVMNYINTYIKQQNDTIEKKISNKSYIHRFAKTEKLWIATDFSEVAAILKVRTLDRIKEISEDVDRKVLNVLNTITNDKELLLEKEVREELEE